MALKQFQPGVFEPTEQMDLIPAMKEDYERIDRSQTRYFDQLRANDKRLTELAGKNLEALSKFSGKFGTYLQERYKQKKEDEEARISWDALTKDLPEEEIEKYDTEEEALAITATNTNNLAAKYEAETGDVINGENFRKLSGDENYTQVKIYVQEEAKKWKIYKEKARETTSVTINGKPYTYETAEGDEAIIRAIDAKILFNFSRRFNGINPVLLNKYAKPTISSENEADRTDREQAQIENIENKRTNEATAQVKNVFIYSDPGEGSQAARDWVDKNLWRHDGDRKATRKEFATILETLIKNKEIDPETARQVVNHVFTKRDGSQGDLTGWREWANLNSVIDEAQKARVDDELEKIETEKNTDIVRVLQLENISNEDQEIIASHFRNKYDYIPEEVKRKIFGDDVYRLNKLIQNQGGLKQSDLDGVEPSIYQMFKHEIKPDRDFDITTPSSNQVKDANQQIKLRLQTKLEETIGVSDTGSEHFNNAYNNLNQKYEEIFQDFIEDKGYSPAAAHSEAIKKIQEIIDASDKPTTGSPAKANSIYEYNYVDYDDERRSKLASAIEECVDKGYEEREIPAPVKDKKALIAISKAQQGDIPDFYKQVASRVPGVSPLMLANAQLKLWGEKPLGKPEEYDPAVFELLFDKPSKSRKVRAQVEHVRLENKIEYNLKTSPFNKKEVLYTGD
tara:strand:- start:7707 stop:9755 length:2049 start_codon:yes stop_codon:yes gene_type:complete